MSFAAVGFKKFSVSIFNIYFNLGKIKDRYEIKTFRQSYF